ncbi:RNA/RNP complex-1-interacting phosphatase [Papilio machaon]|uniref:RNA/RNP complex-1-interacting phosphatase n=1 Tax=Papilio machaon TaxID=76193 RepID=UPI001E662B54|nr:RNA/RNP complex-1-interacting phosphatase [Papilio machaon]
MAGRIPDRWLQYKACGKVIEGTRIICFKVPLKRATQVKHVEENNIWDIAQLLLRIPNIGAVLDLTNTTRYYNPKNFQAVGVLHKKIFIPGRTIPPEEKVTEFINALDGFLEENNKCLVGVHCTHGLNRTGYMVCRYMRDRLGVPAAEAIRRFELARGYHIERDNYIADLLGKTPPPPDEGCDTIVKPIKQQENVEKITCKEKEGISHKRKQEQATISENTKKKKRKRKKHTSDSSSMDKSDRSYDFKYDY